MKRIYLKPDTISVSLVEISWLMANSPTRGIGGGPTEDEGTKLPTVVGETDGNIDPFSDSNGKGRGQGTDGGGTRSKEAGLWDDWSW